MTTIDVEGCHVQLVSHCLLPRPFCQHWKGLKFHIWVCCSEGIFLHHLLPVRLPIFPVINMIYELWLKHFKCTNWPKLTEAKMKKEKLWQLSTAAAVSVSLFHRSKYTNGDAKVRKTDTPSRSQWHESWSKALIEQHHISSDPFKKILPTLKSLLPGKNWIWQKMPLSTDNCHSFALAARS